MGEGDRVAAGRLAEVVSAMPRNQPFNQMEATIGPDKSGPAQAPEFPRPPRDHNTSTQKGRRKPRGYSSTQAADALESRSGKKGCCP